MSRTVNKEVADMLTELLFRFYSACQRYPSAKLSGPKIHSHGFHILFLLERTHEKKLPMQFLLTELQVTKQQMSKLVNELEDFGFIERIRTGRDRRHVAIRMTESGSVYFQNCAQAVSSAIEETIAKQPEGRIDLVRELLYQILEE